jgi:hypothetical protein
MKSNQAEALRIVPTGGMRPLPDGAEVVSKNTTNEEPRRQALNFLAKKQPDLAIHPNPL